ncbi:BTB and MATH domain-containing protein 42 [Parasteatoda tepidariorum]|uniref:BTB and MATH domain-containing protein 42 n=1 Tax=Parasteatoda tepidariorum TaxID=114398 RepID=UPI001C7268DF|nr:BTB/POZ domain-containing protein At4g01160 [Parasteatoda tepidariorum]
MGDIPFSWTVDLELSRIRTLYGNGENPVLPYEPPSTVIKVSKFHLGTAADTEWLLQFEHTKIYDQSFYGQQENAILLLERSNSDGAVEIEGTVSLYDLTTHKRLSKTDFNNYLADGDSTLPIPLDLTMSEFSYIVFENSKLCVQGNVSISHSDDVVVNTGGEVNSSEIHIIQNNPLAQLSYDFLSLLEEGTFSDVTIKCDSSEILAHKNVMSARSPIFAAMFKSSMVEGEGNELVLTDVKLPVLQKMLKFLYSSQVTDLDYETACDLLFVGDKYEISGLVRICVEYLKSSLTADNALEMLTVADLYDSGLKDYVMNYISCYFSYFEDTNELKALKENNHTLIIELLEYTIKYRFSKKFNVKSTFEDNLARE